MNETFQKFLNLIDANFWDWQFCAFVFLSALIFALYLFKRSSLAGFEKISTRAAKLSGKSEPGNYALLAAANVFAIAALVATAGLPVTQTHDEFAYLLAADTFLHGRLVNPTPFSPAHFEYFHILIEPFYAAKYPPLQGVFLSAGTLFAGYPIAGVWLSGVLSTLAVYWLLRYFFSPAWSMYGALLWIGAPLNLLWCDSYWGGHAAVIGGALSLGAFFRLASGGNPKYLVVWGTGIFVLLNSRLYEGALLTAILVVILGGDALKKQRSAKDLFRALAPLALIIAANLSLVALYNYRVTGDPLLLPYRLHHAQYHRTPLFVFQHPGTPKPDVPPVIGKLDERWAADFRSRYENWSSALVSTASRIPVYLFWVTRSPFLLALLLAGLMLSFRDRATGRWRTLRRVCAFFVTGLLLTTFTGDRFVAPLVGLFIVFSTFAARIGYRKSQILGLLGLALPFVVGAGFLYGMIPLKSKVEPSPVDPDNIGSRAELEKFLIRQPGPDLLFLETDAALPADARFYVYNRADLEAAEIVWAHKLSAEENAALIGHFGERKIWLLKNVNHQAVLVRFENQSEDRDLSK